LPEVEFSVLSQPDQNLTMAKLWRAPARQRPAFEDVHKAEQLRLIKNVDFVMHYEVLARTIKTTLRTRLYEVCGHSIYG
jgi:hypothetical protein